MKVFAVRQKSTGLFIPRLETGKRRGGSHLEPSNVREPRIFHNRQAARAFLSNWLQGIFKNEGGYFEMEVNIVKQPHRNKDDMEIVEFDCFEKSKLTDIIMNVPGLTDDQRKARLTLIAQTK
jgi:hypothetical protein